VKKSAQLCTKIAQNKTFSRKNYWSKIGHSKTKSSQNVELIKVNFGRFFEKNAPENRKMRPNGEISPNLVTLKESLAIGRKPDMTDGLSLH
jgi:hypothetical protein